MADVPVEPICKHCERPRAEHYVSYVGSRLVERCTMRSVGSGTEYAPLDATPAEIATQADIKLRRPNMDLSDRPLADKVYDAVQSIARLRTRTHCVIDYEQLCKYTMNELRRADSAGKRLLKAEFHLRKLHAYLLENPEL